MIQKEKWQRCYICNQSLSDIKKLFGGSNVYNFQAMKDHILKHGISLEDYFSKIDYRPNCECGTCNQKCNICTSTFIRTCTYASILKMILEWYFINHLDTRI